MEKNGGEEWSACPAHRRPRTVEAGRGEGGRRESRGRSVRRHGEGRREGEGMTKRSWRPQFSPAGVGSEGKAAKESREDDDAKAADTQSKDESSHRSDGAEPTVDGSNGQRKMGDVASLASAEFRLGLYPRTRNPRAPLARGVEFV